MLGITLVGKITSLKSENHKLEEILMIFKENREFLEKIAPKEWQDKKLNEYNKLYSQLLETYISTKNKTSENEKSSVFRNNKESYEKSRFPSIDTDEKSKEKIESTNTFVALVENDNMFPRI